MTNLEKTNLLCQFYRENPDVANVLLEARANNLEIMRMNPVDSYIPVLEKIWWICMFSNFNSTYLGICNDNTMVRCEYDVVELSFICEGFEHVPYWLRDMEYKDSDQEEIKNHNNFLQPYFDKYTKWCHNHGIFPDWENAKKNMSYSDDPTENPFCIPLKDLYEDYNRHNYYSIEFYNFEEVKIIEKVNLPLMDYLPPCLEPEFIYSGSGDIYQEFFVFYTQYPRSARIFLRNNEIFKDEFRSKYIKELEKIWGRKLNFIPIKQSTLHGF